MTLQELIDLISESPTQVREALELVKRGITDLQELPPGDIDAAIAQAVVRDQDAGTDKRVTLRSAAAREVGTGDSDVPDNETIRETEWDFDHMPLVNGDPIVESDSNDDGEWTWWADGSQMVWINFSADSVDFDSLNPEIGEWPKEFTSSNRMAGGFNIRLSGGDSADLFEAVAHSIGDLRVNVARLVVPEAYQTASESGESAERSCIWAHGRYL